MDKTMFSFYKNALLGSSMIEPLCDEYRNLWKRCGDNKGELIKLALRQQSIVYVATMCYLGKGVTKDYIKSEFGDYINGHTIHDADGVDGYTYGLYVDYDDDKDVVVDKDVVHIMWTKHADVTIPETKCPVVYVSNKSEVSISCGGYNTLRVYAFDESKVILEDVDETSNVIVYAYSDNVAVEQGKFCFGNVKVHHKELRL